MLTSTALVQLMTPGLAFFYGGLVGEGAAISTLMMSFAAMGVVTLLWALVGFSIAFAPSTSTGIVGDLSYAPLNKIGPYTAPFPGAPSISLLTYSMYQLMFAIITSALISGAIVGKMKFNYYVLFTALWHLSIYCPLVRARARARAPLFARRCAAHRRRHPLPPSRPSSRGRRTGSSTPAAGCTSTVRWTLRAAW